MSDNKPDYAKLPIDILGLFDCRDRYVIKMFEEMYKPVQKQLEEINVKSS